MESFPLCWPQGWPRARTRERSKFKTTFEAARRELFRELGLMGVPDYNIILSTSIPIRRDGMPYATARPVDNEVGVAVYFKKANGNKRYVFACDRWDRVEDNMQAIRHSVAAIRGIERWGASEMLERAFTGFTALPEPGKKSWRQVLGLQITTNLEAAESAYRHKMKSAHPDLGGSEEQSKELNWAITEARSELG